MTLLFKVWNLNRDNKVFIPINDDRNQLYIQLVLKASERLQIDGSAIVLESDGTLIEDDDVLRLLNKETLILLTKTQKWKPAGEDLSVSSCSTITLPPSPSSSELQSASSSDMRSVSPKEIDKVSEDTWNNFEIPWNHISPSVINQCQSGSRISEHINSVVNVTVDAVREIKKYASTKTFKIISKKIIQKYPQQFKDMEGDTVFGDGCHTIFRKLVDRNNYLNRPHKRPRDCLSHEIPPKKRKLMLKSKAGCSNWFPDTCTEDSPETLIDKKAVLNSYLEDFTFNEQVISLLNDTYKMQRLFLNNHEPPTILKIKEEWPILFLKPVLFWHFEKLMSQDINGIEQVFAVKANKIIQFGIQKKFIETASENESEKLLNCINILGKFFKEDTTLIIRKLNKDIESTVQLIAPSIIIATDADGNPNKYMVYVEKIMVQTCDELMESVKILFALYYNFNMCYPKEVSNTLEFIQRYILKINPDQGTKSNKKTNSKIYSLINKLRNVS